MRIASAVAMMLACAGVATAGVDMTGLWTFGGSVLFGSSTYSIQQVGTTLTLCLADMSGAGTLIGTIDPETGAMSWTGNLDVPIPVPGGYACQIAWTGTVAPDGSSLAGNERYGVFCVPPPFTCNGECMNVTDHAVTGTRVAPTAVSCGCGNGLVDPGEACDDQSGCCLGCQLAPAGHACPDDGNVCTGDTCDAAGTCQHPPNALPCGTPCAPGTCAGGICAATDLPAGTPCPSDADACTDQACDGAGQCVTTPVTCADPCSQCLVGGCVAYPRTGCVPADHGMLDLTLGATPEKSRARWKLGAAEDAVPAGFPDPTASAEYAFCAYATPADALPVLLLAARAPAGICGTQPCWSWKANGGALTYRDPERTPDGVRRIVLRRPATPVLKVTGRGALLPLASTLPTTASAWSGQLVARDGAAEKCWATTFTAPKIATPTHFRAKY